MTKTAKRKTKHQRQSWVVKSKTSKTKKSCTLGCEEAAVGVLGVLPGAEDKWWQKTAPGSPLDLTNWTPGKGVKRAGAGLLRNIETEISESDV